MNMNKVTFESQVSDGILLTVAGIITVISTVITGLVLPQLWSWFIVPLFNVPEITFWAAIGLSLFVNYIKPSPSPDLSNTSKNKQLELMIRELFTYITRAAMTLVIASFVASQAGLI